MADGTQTVRAYTAEEVAMFIHACADLSGEPEREIVQAVADWEEHMHAGGFMVGREVDA